IARAILRTIVAVLPNAGIASPVAAGVGHCGTAFAADAGSAAGATGLTATTNSRLAAGWIVVRTAGARLSATASAARAAAWRSAPVVAKIATPVRGTRRQRQRRQRRS